MKLSQFAKKAGVTYRTVFRWWQQGQLKGYQMPSGTIVVTEEEAGAPQPPGRVVIYALSPRAHRQRTWSAKCNGFCTTVLPKAIRWLAV